MIRPLRRDELPQLAALDAASCPFPWNEGIFRDCLYAGYQCQVLELDAQSCGFSVVAVAAGEAHLLNLVVHPDYRAQGYGRVLLDDAIDRARCGKASLMLLEVRPSNAVAMSLYRSAGFDQLAVRPNYYPAQEGREDAWVMARHLALQWPL